MEEKEKHMINSLLLGSQSGQSLLGKIGDVFLSRLSANYPSFYNAGKQNPDDEMTVGYEAAWVGVAQQVTKNNKMH